MKLLITGAAGFIGYHLTKQCLENNWHVYGIDKQTYASNTQFLEELKSYPKFKYLCEDINNLQRIHDCDYFINTYGDKAQDNAVHWATRNKSVGENYGIDQEVYDIVRSGGDPEGKIYGRANMFSDPKEKRTKEFLKKFINNVN